MVLQELVELVVSIVSDEQVNHKLVPGESGRQWLTRERKELSLRLTESAPQ